jgi:type IV pilus assembly protein PilA
MIHSCPRTAQNGFTLIELMIVIAVIGVLAAIAIPTYQGFIGRAQLAEAISLISGLKSNVAVAYSQSPVCPSNVAGSLTSKGTATADTITGEYVLSVTTGGPATPSPTADCTITALMRPSGVAPGLENMTVTYKMVWSAGGSGGATSWACTSTALQKYLPSTCSGSSS